MSSLTERGEYDLAALAFLTRLFGREGNPPRLRVFAGGLYQEVEWNLADGGLQQIRDLMTSLRGRRRARASFADTGMPALFGIGCGLGVGGVVLSQTLPQLRDNPNWNLGVGLTSAGTAGAGCFGLAGHYLWPAVFPRRVHNRYAWDIGSSVVGSALGVGGFLLFHFLFPTTSDPTRRFPVDPYGP